MSEDPSVRELAARCVAEVAARFGRQLDWSLASLTELDLLCAGLLADGPLGDDTCTHWWRLIGAYTGEVLIRAHGGTWIAQEGAPAIMVDGVTARPYRVADRVLAGAEATSLTAFARALPEIVRRSTPRD